MLCFFAPVLAQAQTLEFQGLKIGDSIDTVKARYDGAQCVKLTTEEGELTCMVKAIDYAVPLRDAMFSFEKNQLTLITAEFDTAAYGTLRQAAITRFGKPSSTTPLKVQNGFGATRSGTTVIWERDGLSLMIGEYGETLTNGRVFFQSSKPKPDKTKQNAGKM